MDASKSAKLPVLVAWAKSQTRSLLNGERLPMAMQHHTPGVFNFLSVAAAGSTIPALYYLFHRHQHNRKAISIALYHVWEDVGARPDYSELRNCPHRLIALMERKVSEMIGHHFVGIEGTQLSTRDAEVVVRELKREVWKQELRRTSRRNRRRQLARTGYAQGGIYNDDRDQQDQQNKAEKGYEQEDQDIREDDGNGASVQRADHQDGEQHHVDELEDEDDGAKEYQNPHILYNTTHIPYNPVHYPYDPEHLLCDPECPPYDLGNYGLPWDEEVLVDVPNADPLGIERDDDNEGMVDPKVQDELDEIEGAQEQILGHNPKPALGIQHMSENVIEISSEELETASSIGSGLEPSLVPKKAHIDHSPPMSPAPRNPHPGRVFRVPSPSTSSDEDDYDLPPKGGYGFTYSPESPEHREPLAVSRDGYGFSYKDWSSSEEDSHTRNAKSQARKPPSRTETIRRRGARSMTQARSPSKPTSPLIQRHPSLTNTTGARFDPNATSSELIQPLFGKPYYFNLHHNKVAQSPKTSPSESRGSKKSTTPQHTKTSNSIFQNILGQYEGRRLRPDTCLNPGRADKQAYVEDAPEEDDIDEYVTSIPHPPKWSPTSAEEYFMSGGGSSKPIGMTAKTPSPTEIPKRKRNVFAESMRLRSNIAVAEVEDLEDATKHEKLLAEQKRKFEDMRADDILALMDENQKKFDAEKADLTRSESRKSSLGLERNSQCSSNSLERRMSLAGWNIQQQRQSPREYKFRGKFTR